MQYKANHSSFVSLEVVRIIDDKENQVVVEPLDDKEVYDNVSIDESNGATYKGEKVRLGIVLSVQNHVTGNIEELLINVKETTEMAGTIILKKSMMGDPFAVAAYKAITELIESTQGDEDEET